MVTVMTKILNIFHCCRPKKSTMLQRLDVLPFLGELRNGENMPCGPRN
jgi:hypothetical protein